jgi:S-formylglutathione hydrolase FrmB
VPFGGTCATMLALRHPEEFDTVSGFSGFSGFVQ